MQAVLDDLFDQTHYPQGMTREGVVAYAEAHLNDRIKAAFPLNLKAPLELDVLYVQGKWNDSPRRGARHETSNEHIGHSLDVTSYVLLADIQQAAAALAPQPVAAPEVEIGPSIEKPEPFVEAATIMRVVAPDYAAVPFFMGEDLRSRVTIAREALSTLCEAHPKLQRLGERILQAVNETQVPPRKLKKVADYVQWLENDSATALRRKLDLVEGLRAPERRLLMDTYREQIPVMVEEAKAIGDWHYERACARSGVIPHRQTFPATENSR